MSSPVRALRLTPFVVYTVLISLRRTHSLSAFFKLIDKKPIAISLLQVYARENDVELLKDFYYQDDRRREMAMLALEEGASLKDFGERVSKVREAAKSFGEDKESGFEAKVRYLTAREALTGTDGRGADPTARAAAGVGAGGRRRELLRRAECERDDAYVHRARAGEEGGEGAKRFQSP